MDENCCERIVSELQDYPFFIPADNFKNIEITLL
jgi:hypothetical protein